MSKCGLRFTVRQNDKTQVGKNDREVNRNTERHSVESKFRITEMLSLFCDKAYYKHP